MKRKMLGAWCPQLTGGRPLDQGNSASRAVPARAFRCILVVPLLLLFGAGAHVPGGEHGDWNKTTLLIDDDTTLLEMLSEQLDSSGEFTTTTAETAARGIELAKTRPSISSYWISAFLIRTAARPVACYAILA